MCTLSLIRPFDSAEGSAVGPPQGGPLWRVMFNRDEQRSRPAARPPESRLHGGVRAIHPIDPPSEGTWIAATSARLVFALLNEYQRGREPLAVPPDSRGRIIPELLDVQTIADVERRVQRLDVARFLPFRLVVIDADVVEEFVSDGRALRSTASVRSDRWMCTSSSVSPEAVRAIRTSVFERCVTQRSLAAQECFHTFVCADRPEAGVRMARPDARTVSVTTVEVLADRIRMAYCPFLSDTEVLAAAVRRITA